MLTIGESVGNPGYVRGALPEDGVDGAKLSQNERGGVQTPGSSGGIRGDAPIIRLSEGLWTLSERQKGGVGERERLT